MASTTISATSALGEFRPPSMALATIALSLGTFMQVLDMSIANVSLPTIAGFLAVSQDQSTWVITMFTVCQAITLPMTGFLSRRFGQVKVFVTCVLLFSLFSLCCGMSTSLMMLITFRALQGAACGPMYPITQSLMVSIYPRDRRGVAIAIISMITVVAPIVGPVAGGWITDSYSWRWIFLVNVPIGVFAAVVAGLQMRGKVETAIREHIDWVGVFFLIVGVGSLQIMLNKGEDDDWFSSTFIITMAVIAGISLATWVIWELTEDKPVVDLRLFRHRNFSAGTLVMVLGYALFFSISLLIPLWLQGTLGYTALWSGLAVAPIGVFPLLLSYWVGKYAGQLDLRFVMAASFLVMGTVCLMIGNFNTDVNVGHIALVELLFGLGITLFFTPVLTVVLSELQGAEVAEGSGSSTFMRTVGASFAVSIVTYVWFRETSVSHADLGEFINPFRPLAQQHLQATGQALTHQAMAINRVISQQASQIAFNHIFDVLGVIAFALILVAGLAKPPFVARGAAPHPDDAHAVHAAG